MRNLFLVALACFGLTANAGGIAFKRTYVGMNPVSGTKVTLEFSDTTRSASITVEDTLGRASDLKVEPVSRNNFETVFHLQSAGQDAPVAKIVTTGDCQVVARLALVFPSGVIVPMKAISND